jgi:hypothetical protein
LSTCWSESPAGLSSGSIIIGVMCICSKDMTTQCTPHQYPHYDQHWLENNLSRLDRIINLSLFGVVSTPSLLPNFRSSISYSHSFEKYLLQFYHHCPYLVGWAQPQTHHCLQFSLLQTYSQWLKKYSNILPSLIITYSGFHCGTNSQMRCDALYLDKHDLR